MKSKSCILRYHRYFAFILLGLIAGWIAGKLVQGNGFLFELAAAVLGAIILIAFVRMIKRL